jgi:hypothetical protein
MLYARGLDTMIETLTPFKDRKYIPVEEALKQLKAYKAPQLPVPDAPHIVLPVEYENFAIEEFPGSFMLYNVQYRNKIYNIEWLKSNLYHDRLTQDAALKVKIQGFTLPSTDTYYASFFALYTNPYLVQEEAFKNFHSYMTTVLRDEPMMTKTRIVYNPACKDTVMHETVMEEDTFKELEFSGPDAWMLPGSGLEEHAKALFGIDQLEHVDNVGDFLDGKRIYLVRRPEKPLLSTVYAPVTIELCKDRLKINANTDPDEIYPAQGVRCQRIK